MTLYALFTAALEASWQGALAIAALLALRPLLGARIPPGWRSFLWLLVLVRLLVPAAILPVSRTSLQNFAIGEQAVQRVRLAWEPRPAAAAAILPGAKASGGRALPKARIDLWNLAAQVWLAGVALSGMWLAGGALSLRRRLARESTAVDERVARIWQACCASVSVRRPPRLLATDAVTSPALVGVLRPMLLFPRHQQDQLSRADCEHIFLHELAHFQRGDHWTHLLQLCAACVHWFNPSSGWGSVICGRIASCLPMSGRSGTSHRIEAPPMEKPCCGCSRPRARPPFRAGRSASWRVLRW